MANAISSTWAYIKSEISRDVTQLDKSELERKWADFNGSPSDTPLLGIPGLKPQRWFKNFNILFNTGFEKTVYVQNAFDLVKRTSHLIWPPKNLAATVYYLANPAKREKLGLVAYTSDYALMRGIYREVENMFPDFKEREPAKFRECTSTALQDAYYRVRAIRRQEMNYLGEQMFTQATDPMKNFTESVAWQLNVVVSSIIRFSKSHYPDPNVSPEEHKRALSTDKDIVTVHAQIAGSIMRSLLTPDDDSKRRQLFGNPAERIRYLIGEEDFKTLLAHRKTNLPQVSETSRELCKEFMTLMFAYVILRKLEAKAEAAGKKGCILGSDFNDNIKRIKDLITSGTRGKDRVSQDDAKRETDDLKSATQSQAAPLAANTNTPPSGERRITDWDAYLKQREQERQAQSNSQTP